MRLPQLLYIQHARRRDAPYAETLDERAIELRVFHDSEEPAGTSDTRSRLTGDVGRCAAELWTTEPTMHDLHALERDGGGLRIQHRPDPSDRQRFLEVPPPHRQLLAVQ